MMSTMISTDAVRARLASIIAKVARVMECDNLEVCPLCEVRHPEPDRPKPHGAHCGFHHAGLALVELVALDCYLREKG